MPGKSLRKLVLAGLEKITILLAGPFLRSESLENYSKWGYIYLGFFFLGTTAVLWLSGYLSYPLSRTNHYLQAAYKLMLEKTPFKFIPDDSITLIALPLLLYVSLLFWEKPRKWVGEKFANSLTWLISKSIAAGEWCIEHRWGTLFLIIIMVALLSLGLNKVFRDFRHDTALTQSFNHWIVEAQIFIEQSPFVKQEIERYDHVRLDWNDDFNGITHLPGRYIHPALYLNRMLEQLYSEKSEDTAWQDLLISKLPDLISTMEECKSNLRDKRTPSEESAWSLMNILMGRIYARLSEDNKDYQMLFEALKHFQEIKYRPFQSAANNGRGTIYATAFSAYAPTTALPLNKSEPSEKPRAICTDSYQCAIEALSAYEMAANGSEVCSFQDKRRMNNTIDLLMRIAMQYDEIVKGRTSTPIENWLLSPDTLANELETRLEQLLRCNSKEPFISTIFVTAAQAYAVSAKLRLQSNKEASSQLIAAGTYLRFAYSLEPNNISDWELAYFCSIASREDTFRSFSEAFSSNLYGLPKGEKLLRRIKQKCP